ncbi:MAG: Com family DNA-binding transcriptional regulator [Thermodesulfovibrionia bacterium]
MKEIRCKQCNRLLMKGIVVVIQIKCRKCKYTQFFTDLSKPKLKKFLNDT